MSKKTSKLLYRISKAKSRKIKIGYCNNCPSDIGLSLTCNHTGVLHRVILEKQGEISFLPDYEFSEGDIILLQFEVSKLWKPCDFSETSDNRDLGIAVCFLESD